MKVSIIFKIALILALITVIFVIIGCNRNTRIERNGEYLILTEKNQLCSFSFEYNDRYTRVGPRYVFDFSPQFMYVTLLSSKALTNVIIPVGKDKITTAVAEYVPASIEIRVSGLSESIYAAKNSKEKLEAALEDWSKWKDYQLMERYPMNVSGKEEEFIEYFAANEHKCAVYIDHNGRIWSVELSSKGNYDYSNVKADFDHILQTFKILD
jgi:hypothetical protein